MGDQKPTSADEATPSPRMNPEIRAAWVAWLRDPKHQQGHGTLRRQMNSVFGPEGDALSCFCCLGGLCELAVDAGIVFCRTYDTSVATEHTYTAVDNPQDRRLADLPQAVLAWAGLKESDPHVVWKGQHVSLVQLNDRLGVSFAGIADIIEEQL
jgi:hypothetical protein